MLKEFAQYLVSLKENKIYDINGEKYSDSSLVRVPKHIDRPKQITVYGLDSIVALIQRESERFTAQCPIFVNVKSEREVEVFTSFDEQMERLSLYRAECKVNALEEGYRGRETAIIELRSRCVQNDGTEYLLDLLSRINIENGVTTTDNGVSQAVEARSGISLKKMENIKPRVNLIPYRTFLEVEQPESEFLLRLDKDGNIGFFEADGGMWKLDAKRRIADYFAKSLATQIACNQVVVMQ